MDIFEIVDENHPILKEVMPIFNFGEPPIDPNFLCENLFRIMKEQNAVGLAANQVGLSYRVFVMEVDGMQTACFNPEIISVSSEINRDMEGCVSFPDLWLNVKRPISIETKFQDKNGFFVYETFANFAARVYSHETDHLNGIRFIDLVGSLSLGSA